MQLVYHWLGSDVSDLYLKIQNVYKTNSDGGDATSDQQISKLNVN